MLNAIPWLIYLNAQMDRNLRHVLDDKNAARRFGLREMLMEPPI
jgi:hypothetical protein